MNWLKKLSQNNYFATIWKQLLQTDPISHQRLYAVNQMAQNIRNQHREHECCSGLQTMTGSGIDEQGEAAKALYNELNCFDVLNQGTAKQMPTQTIMPAGVTLKDETGNNMEQAEIKEMPNA